MALKILINGAGIAGPALSLILLRSDPNYDITIVERSSGLRTAGQQIDLRAQGIPVVRKLGLLEAIKTRAVEEKGVALFDAKGRERAKFCTNDSGKGPQSITSEYEIMRGDLVDLLYDASLEAGEKARDLGKGGKLRYVFGTYMTALEQNGNGVDVIFSDGKTDRFDLVVGADGQGSKTRRLAFGQKASDDAFKSFDLYFAYFSIPREKGDGDLARVYNMPGRRAAFTRTNNRPVTQAYLGTMQATDELRESFKQPIEKQKEIWASIMRDDGWQMKRIVDAMLAPGGAEDFYSQAIGQIKMDRWTNGRAVLLGDAGYCPAVLTGMGTSSALVGAYVLAGELARHPGDVETALAYYNEKMRPFVEEAQKTLPGLQWLMYPNSRWGIRLLHVALGLAARLRVDKLIFWLFAENKGGWELPEYPELKL